MESNKSQEKIFLLKLFIKTLKVSQVKQNQLSNVELAWESNDHFFNGTLQWGLVQTTHRLAYLCCQCGASFGMKLARREVEQQ